MRCVAGVLGLSLSVATPSAARQYADPYDASFLAAMEGRSEAALRAAREAANTAASRPADRTAPRELAAGSLYATMVTFGRWDELLREPLPPSQRRLATAVAYYARGVAFAAKGRWPEAFASLDTVAAVASQREGESRTALEIATHALEGEIALRRDEAVAAVRHFQAAVSAEDRVSTRRPVWYYPVRQSLGKALLAAGRPVEAEQAYREDLARFPENGWSLFGLAQALEAQGRSEAAAEVERRFRRVWEVADVRLHASRF